MRHAPLGRRAATSLNGSHPGVDGGSPSGLELAAELRGVGRGECASESDRHISGVLTEAIQEYLERRRVRPTVLQHLDDSMDDNEELGELLAR